MKDNLEQFISEHKEAFDVHDAPNGLWKKLDQQLTPKKRRTPYYAIAATIVLLVGIGLGLMRRPAPHEQLAENTMTLSPDLRDAENYYTAMVESRKEELEKSGQQYPGLFQDFNRELDTLHSIYAQLKEAYISSNGNPAVLKAMISNLQLQWQLTGRELEILQELQERKKPKSHHSNTI